MVEVIGAFILEAFLISDVVLLTVGTTSLTLASVVGTLAITAAAIGLSILTAPNAARGGGQGVSIAPAASGHQAVRLSIPACQSAYGRVRMAGAYVFYEESAGVSYDVMAIHQGRIGGFLGYYLHDDAVTIDASGIVNSAVVNQDGRYTGTTGVSSAGNYIKIKTRDGLDTETAYSEITAPFPVIWTENHRGDGIASAALICRGVGADVYTKVYPSQKPELSAVIDSSLNFDQRDEAQDHDDPTTWDVSTNPVIQLQDYLTNTDRGGLGLSWDRVVAPGLDALAAEADICDEPVDLKEGGTEPRYQAAGFYAHEIDPVSVLTQIAAAADMWWTLAGDGRLTVVVGSYRAPTVTLDAADIIGVDLKYGVEDERLVNQYTWNFTSPDNDYKDTPGQPWRDEASISEIGRVRSHPVPLTWVQSHSQGRRLLKRQMLRNNARLRGTAVCWISAVRIIGERWITLDFPLLQDTTNIVVEVQAIKIDVLNARVVVDWVYVNPNTVDAWDPETEEGDAPPLPDRVTGELLAAPQDVNVTVGLDSSGNVYFQVIFDDPGRSDLSYRVRYRVKDIDSGTVGNQPGPWISQDFPPTAAVGGVVTLNTSLVQANTLYQVQVASVGTRGVLSDFSAIEEVTSTNDPTAPSAPTFGTVSNVGALVTVTWTNPNSANTFAARVWRGTTTFAAATDISGQLFGSPNQGMSNSNTPGSGTWKYWVTVENAAGVRSTPAGPGTITL
jgi:hypothetical protein